MAELKDSGQRREFSSGAERDADEEKGRCDLLPLDIVASLIFSRNRDDRKSDITLLDIHHYLGSGNRSTIERVIISFSEKHFNSLEEALLEVSIHFKDGAKKYNENNWRLGIPLSVYIDSGVRHYLKHSAHLQDEPHDRAFLWNMICLLWTADNFDVSNRDIMNLPWCKEEAKFEEGADVVCG